jgi:uncharacterized protein YdaU (DUF1376 family)
MNFYPFHIGDYKSHTSHLTWDEDMAYRRLLDVYYTAEEPLADDLRKIFRLVCAATEAQRTAVETVLHEFFVLTDGGWINTRADAELSVMQSKRMKAKASASMRWDSERNANAMRTHTKVDANAYETLCEGNATNTNTNTITNKEQKPYAAQPAAAQPKKGSRLSPDFELTAELREFCITARPDLDPEGAFATFRDYWVAQPGAKGCKLDWDATWRNWVRNSRTLQTRSAASELARAMEMIN